MTQTRMTRQRAVILDELRKVKTHPTADEIYGMVRELLPRISLGTVYRNLDFLAETGKILKLESAGAIMRFDGDTSYHQHIRCIRCGTIADVMQYRVLPNFEDIYVKNFTLIRARIEYDGICDDCAHSD